MNEQIGKKFLNKIAITLLLFLFILNIRANDVTTFGINESEIPRLYVKFLIENENGKEDYIQWQIGAFLVDQFILNEINIIKGIAKNKQIEKFEQKFNKYKEMKYKNNGKFGLKEVRHFFIELISDEYLEEQILKTFEFEENWKTINEIQVWEKMEKEEQNGIIGWNLKMLIKKLHQNEMEKLLVNLEEDKKGVKKYNQSELSKAIQEMNNDESNKNITKEEEENKKIKKFESMKERMRKMVGAEWTFKHLEETEPILMRYDIIEPNELFRIYKILLSPSTPIVQQEEYRVRLETAIMLKEIWNLKKTKKGLRIENSLNKFWQSLSEINRREWVQISRMLKKWMELEGNFEPKKENKNEHSVYMEKKGEYEKKLCKINKEKLFKIYKEKKEFKEFMDENVGTRAKILRLFGWDIANNIEQIFIWGKMEMNFYKFYRVLAELLRLNYLEVFTSTKDKILREKAAMRIFILIGVKYLDEQFGIESERREIVFENLKNNFEKLTMAALEIEWKDRYRPMFFFYLDQMEDSDWDSCKNNGIIYRNMLYKLRKFMKEQKWKSGKWNLRHELKLATDFMSLKENSKAKIEDKKQQMEILKEENTKIILELKKKFPKLKATIDALKLEDREELFYFLIYGRKRSSDSLDTYKEYIEENNGEMLEELKEQVNLDATLWHYKNIFYNLFKSIKYFKNSQNDTLLKNWEENLKNYKEENYQGKKRKLCELQYFIENSLVNNEEIKILYEWKNLKDLPKIGNVSCNDNKRVDVISSLIVKMQTNKKKIYFDYLDWLITNFEEFQQFLMKLDSKFKLNIINILNVENKDGLKKFELFGKLEKKHPKWLKIDEMYLDMRMELYKSILKTKEYLPESMISQRRIAMTFLVWEMKKAQNASEKCGLGILYPEDFKMIKEKIDKLLEEIYEKRGENFDSMENICILTRFRQLIELNIVSIQGKNVNCIEHNGKKDLVKEYKSDLCKQKDVQNLAWEHQKQLFALYHEYSIASGDYNIEYKKLIKKLGGMIRLKLLVPNSMDKGRTFSEIKDFSMDSILREHFLEVLYPQNEEDRAANKMALNFFSWARYIDKKLENMEKLKNTKTKPKILTQIWQERRLDLLNNYDELGNMEMHLLIDNTIVLARFHLDILEVIEKAENEVFTKEKLKEIFNEILSKYEKRDKDWGENNGENTFIEYSNRIQEFNRDELLHQFNMVVKWEKWGERQQFRDKIFEGLKNDVGMRTFINLIGEEGIDILFNNNKPTKVDKTNKKGKLKTLSKKKERHEMKKPKEIGISSSDIGGKLEGQENVSPSSKTLFVNNESAESSGNASNTLLNSSIVDSKDSELHVHYPNLIDESQQNNSIIHSMNSEIHTDKIVEENNQTEVESKKITGDSVDFNKEEQRNIKVKKKSGDNQKSRPNKKERIARNKAEQDEMWRKKQKEKAEVKAREKEEAKAKEEEANKIKLKEERKQINEHLITEKLVELLKNKGYGEFPDPDEYIENEERRMASRKKYLNQSEFTILEMMEILAKWNKESRMLISGSMQLKLNSIDSDIDLIVLLPYEPSENWQNEFDKNFMGDFETKCIEKKCVNGDKISLYCFLCQENKVISLEKIYGNVPLIKMRLKRNIPVDINMALVPKELLRNFPTISQLKLENYEQMKEKMENIMKNQPSLTEIDELIRNIIIGIGAEHLRMSIGDKRNGMIFTLSGYRANKQIVELLPKEENYRNFQIAFLALKLWAKNHFIYSSIFGFFSGTTLAVMNCKLVMELGENASAIAIMEQFFHKYHKNGNEILEEIHLEFDKNDQEIRNELDWKREKEAWRGTSGWKVITPGFPTQNAAFQIIPPSDRIINTELGNGLKKVGEIRKLIEKNGRISHKEIQGVLTNLLFSTQKFEDKFSHFVTIVCKYPSESANGPEFCNQIKIGFALHRIHSQQIDYFHIKPERIINKRICPEQFQIENEEKFCTIWLAGIKLKDNINAENVDLDTAINWKENSEELITYRWKLHEEYKFFDATFQYFSKEDLLKWMPQPKKIN